LSGYRRICKAFKNSDLYEVIEICAQSGIGLYAYTTAITEPEEGGNFTSYYLENAHKKYDAIRSDDLAEMTIWGEDYYLVEPSILNTLAMNESEYFGESEVGYTEQEFLMVHYFYPHMNILRLASPTKESPLTKWGMPKESYSINNLYIKSDSIQQVKNELEGTPKEKTLTTKIHTEDEYKDTVPHQKLKLTHEAIIFSLIQAIKADAESGMIKEFSMVSKFLTESNDSFVTQKLADDILENHSKYGIEKDSYKAKTLSQKINELLNKFS
jgi:hypothetical protein